MEILVAPSIVGLFAYLMMSAICLHQLDLLGLPPEERLQDWQRELRMLRVFDLRQFVPESLFRQAKYQIRIWSLCIAVFVGLMILTKLLPKNPIVFDLRWFDLMKLVPTVFLAIESIVRRFSSFDLTSDRHISFREQSTRHTISRFAKFNILICSLFPIVWNLQEWLQNRNEVTALLDAILMLLGCLFLFTLRNETIVGRTGLFHNNSYLSPYEIHEYRLYENGKGVLFICDPKFSRPPLMIVPIPEEHFDEVAEILAEFLPDKREEDVEPALARIALETAEETQLDPVA